MGRPGNYSLPDIDSVDIFACMRSRITHQYRLNIVTEISGFARLSPRNRTRIPMGRESPQTRRASTGSYARIPALPQRTRLGRPEQLPSNGESEVPVGMSDRIANSKLSFAVVEFFTHSKSHPWIQSGRLKQLPLDDSLRLIESWQACCNVALRRQRFDNPSRDAKVIRPPIQAWMK